MTQAAAGTSSPAKTSTPETGVVHVAGRITYRRKYRTRDGQTAVSHILKTPAPDAFTSPGTLEVHAPRALGEVGDDVAGRVRLSGYGRSYQVTDPDTGDKRAVQTADHRLTWLD